MAVRSSGKCCSGKIVDVTITLGPDGRVLFGDLTAELLPVASALCPRDKGLRKRQELARAMGKK